MAKLTLKKPIMIDGVERTEIEYDLDALTGEDIQQATKEMNKSGSVPTTIELDANYHAAIFAMAAGISFEDVKRFSARDYAKCSSLVRDFFLVDTEE